MGATYANIIRIAGGNIPPSRHVQRLVAIFNKRAIVDFVNMQRRVDVGAVTLRGKVGRGRGRGVGVSWSTRV
jgi:hypothetical protein